MIRLGPAYPSSAPSGPIPLTTRVGLSSHGDTPLGLLHRRRETPLGLLHPGREVGGCAGVGGRDRPDHSGRGVHGGAASVLRNGLGCRASLGDTGPNANEGAAPEACGGWGVGRGGSGAWVGGRGLGRVGRVGGVGCGVWGGGFGGRVGWGGRESREGWGVGWGCRVGV